MLNNNYSFFIDELNKQYPNATCQLNFHNNYEMIIAVVLSAQITDIAVNKVTLQLFEKYPTFLSLSTALLTDVENIIKPLGLYHNKAVSIINLSKEIVDKYDGNLPNNFDDLIKLPGVGRKVANVALIEGFNIPACPVDTHIYRIIRQCGFVETDSSLLDVEKYILEKTDKDRLCKLHHQLITFGRNICTARNPKCSECFYNKYCTKQLLNNLQ